MDQSLINTDLARLEVQRPTARKGYLFSTDLHKVYKNSKEHCENIIFSTTIGHYLMKSCNKNAKVLHFIQFHQEVPKK